MNCRRAIALVGPAVILLSGLAGCSKFYWTKPGSTVEQFEKDSRECAIQASPPAMGGQINSTLYQACLRTAGYVRASQNGTPAPGSYRGLDDEGEPIVITAPSPGVGTTVGAFEEELAKLDDLKARGLITADEHTAMRRRLVEAYKPTARAPVPAAAVSA